MEELPKIVKARLAMAPPSEHPDANLLSAFSEGALSVRERGEVLQHLSACPACREIAALSLPEPEEAIAMAAAVGMSPRAMVSAPVAEPTLGRGFNLRWGALAACAVIVAGIVFLTRHPKQNRVTLIPPGTMTASKAPEQQIAEVREQAEQLGMPARSVPDHPRRAQKNVAAKPVGPLDEIFKEKEHPRTSEPMGSGSGGGIGSGNGRGVGLGNVLATPASPQPASIGDQPGPAELQGVPAARANTSLAKAESAAPPATQKQDALQAKEKDKKNLVSTGALGATEVNGLRNLDLSAASVRWTLSEGKLRRSSDAGETWENVRFDEDGQFRALSVMGRELWVGGVKGVLYHSSDGGTLWVHVIPTAANETLVEDIARIEFSDAHHGKLITPHSEWRTSNRGASWHKK